jgi:hypothetical protein
LVHWSANEYGSVQLNWVQLRGNHYDWDCDYTCICIYQRKRFNWIWVSWVSIQALSIFPRFFDPCSKFDASLLFSDANSLVGINNSVKVFWFPYLVVFNGMDVSSRPSGSWLTVPREKQLVKDETMDYNKLITMLFFWYFHIHVFLQSFLEIRGMYLLFFCENRQMCGWLSLISLVIKRIGLIF